MDPPFHQLRQTSRARAPGVHPLTLKVWGLECHTYGPSHTSISQRGWLVPRHHRPNISAMAITGTAHFRRKATTHTGEPIFLYHVGCRITCVAHRVKCFLSHRLTRIHSTESLWRERSHSKHPKQSPMYNEIEEWLRKNILWAAISIGRVYPLRENRGCHLTWPHLVSFEKTWVQCREVYFQTTYFWRQAKNLWIYHTSVLI